MRLVRIILEKTGACVLGGMMLTIRICCSRWLSSAATAFRTQLISGSENGMTISQDADTQADLLPAAPGSHESPSFMHDPLAQKFINCMMWDGKKSLSQRMFREALEVVKRTQLSRYRASDGKSEVDLDPLIIFHKAVQNAKPIMGTTTIRRGGKRYYVPTPLPMKRQQFLAVKWLIHAARTRKKHGMSDNLAVELLDAYNNQGTVIKRKRDLHRLAEANRAFAHFRW